MRFLQQQHMRYKREFRLFKIGDFLKRSARAVTVENDQVYKQVTVKLFNKGVITRCVNLGKDIGTKKQYLVSAGQFIISKIDARNGAFGIVPDELEGAIVTADFVPYDIILDKIDPEFLVLLTGTQYFASICQNSSSGTTGRQRIKENEFLSIQIPIPDLLTQRKIISDFNARVNESLRLEESASKINEAIDEYLSSELGVSIALKNNVKNKIYLANFTDISRWDVWKIKSIPKSNKYTNSKLSDVIIGKPMYGANVKGVSKKSSTRYIRITDINEDGSLNNDIVYPEYIDEKFLLRENDFLIARSGNTVGKTFLYREGYGRCIFAGYLVKYNLDESKIYSQYLLYYTKSKLYKYWISINQRISGQPNINGQEYLASPVILPPLTIQIKVAETISKMRTEVQALNRKAIANRKAAINDFENSIFH